jgi:hypothetical protein
MPLGAPQHAPRGLHRRDVSQCTETVVHCAFVVVVRDDGMAKHCFASPLAPPTMASPRGPARHEAFTRSNRCKP